MNLTVLRAHALQREDATRMELAEAARELQEWNDRIARLEARAGCDADTYLEQARRGGTAEELFAHLDAMNQALETRKRMEERQTSLQSQWATKRDAVLEAMRDRKKLDLLVSRAQQEQRRRQERQDQALLDERAWRRNPLRPGERE